MDTRTNLSTAEMNPNEEIDLLNLLKVLWQKIRIILIVTLIGGVVGFGFAKFAGNVTYTSSFTAAVTADADGQYINDNDTSGDKVDLLNDLAYMYLEVLKSDEVIDTALENAGLQDTYTSSQVASAITTTKNDNTHIITFSVAMDSAENAYGIAKAVADTAPAQMSQIIEGSSMTVVTEPSLADVSASSNVKRYTLIGLLLGAFIMCVIVITIELVNPRLRNKDEIARKLGLPVVGTIPGTPAVAGEAYRILRTNLASILSEDGSKLVGITSARNSDGKDEVAIGCAESFGQLGKKVLLIDADLRNPVCAGKLGAKNDKGLCDILAGKTELKDALQSPDDCKLALLSAGETSQDPTLLLQSDKMDDLLKSAKDQFDYVFINMPPVLETADASILSEKTDGYMIVLKDQNTELKSASAMLAQLDIVGTQIIGAVYTGIKAEGGKKKA